MSIRAAVIIVASIFTVVGCATGTEPDDAVPTPGTTHQAMTNGAEGGETGGAEVGDPWYVERPKSGFDQCLGTCAIVEPTWSKSDCRDMCTCLWKDNREPRECYAFILSTQ